MLDCFMLLKLPAHVSISERIICINSTLLTDEHVILSNRVSRFLDDLPTILGSADLVT